MQESGSHARRHAASSLVLFLCMTLVEPCLGQTLDSDQAIRIAYEARAQFEAGHFREALQLFERARLRASTPTFDLYIARCHKALGEWKAAVESYARSVNAPQDPANVAWSTAQASAALELRELEQKLPRLTVGTPHLSGGTSPTVSLDGEPLSWPIVSYALDPGKHVLVARHAGREYSHEWIVIAGERATLELPFKDAATSPLAQAPAKQPLEARDEVHGAASQSSLAPWIWGSAVSAGVGAAIGSVTGILALTTAAEVRDWCRSEAGGCPENTPGSAEVQAKADLSRGLGDASTVSFIAAGAFTAAAITLWILDRRTDDPERPGSRARVELRPYLDVGLSFHAEF